ncbi:MAG: hypothetical protein WCS70_01100 [Verrucomicrobiota bacterium]
MKKVLLIFIALTLIVAAAILIFNRGGRSPAGAELLPESTLLFVDAPDFQAAREQLRGTPLAALWAEPEVQAFLQKPLAAVQGGLKKERWEEALALPQGEVFVAITRFAATPKTEVGGAVGIDCKLHKVQAFAYLKVYEHQLAKYNPAATLEKKNYLSIDYTVVHASPAAQFCYGFLGTLLVGTTDEEQMRDMITRFTRNALPEAVSLAGSMRFQNAIQRLPKNSAGHAFINMEQLFSQYGMLLLMAAQGSPMLESLGNIQATTVAVNFDGAGLTDSSIITYSKDHQPDPPIQQSTLAVAPGDSALYAVQSTDLAGGFTKLMEALARSGNPTALKIGGDLDKYLSDAGVRLSDDFLTHLGPEVAYIGNWRSGARSPDFALVAEVKDPITKFDTIVETIKKTVERTDDITHAGETLHVIRTGSSYAAPTYVLTEKYFVLALTPDYAKEIITQIKSGTTSLADSAEFKSVAQRVPTGGSSFTYCDLRKVMGGLYTLAHATATNTDSFIAWNKLPQPETIMRHLGPYVSTTVEGAKASTTTTYSPIGKPLTYIVALAGGIGAAQPLLAQIPWASIPGLPTASSSTGAPPPPPDNQKATSQTPAP